MTSRIMEYLLATLVPVEDKKDSLEKIEKRYTRISTDRRRPSLEYIKDVDILSIFIHFVDDKETLLKMSSSQLQELYDRWYEEIYLPSLPKNETS